MTTAEGDLLLERASSSSVFLSSYGSAAAAAGFAFAEPLATFRQGKSKADEWGRRAQFGQLDIFAVRPELVRKRILYAAAVLLAYFYHAVLSDLEALPSRFTLVMITIIYPLGLYLVGQFMSHRARPAEKYVFECLLVFDVYHLISNFVIFAVTFWESYYLGLLAHPWGNDSALSSPLMKKMMCLHYHNHIIELLDTVARISQKKFQAYGALHIYLRLVVLWGWFEATHIGGGDVCLHTLIDSAVTCVRFSIFTLSLLRWNWNLYVDFGLNAPKIPVFRKEYFFYIQIGEFVMFFLHAFYAGFWCGSMPRGLALFEAVAAVNAMSLLTDFQYARDKPLVRDEKRLTFSFDSSCWLFLYHFGVAKWIEDNIEVKAQHFAFSGSSGGALVAASCAAGFNMTDVKESILSHFHKCQRNPLLMFHVGELVLDKFLRDTDAHVRCTGVCRVLLTKVSPWPPIFKAEVASNFKSWEELFSCLRGSMHVPIAGGILPYPVPGRGWYYDGLIWASLFVPWRAFEENDELVKVSACGFPGAHIRPRFPFPLWWLIMPPSREALEGLFWLGYKDTQDFFEGQMKLTCAKRQDSAHPPQQAEALFKHRRSNPVNSFDERAQQLCSQVIATGVMHWQIFFACLLLALAGGVFFVYICFWQV